VTEARVERITPDRVTAREFLEQGKVFLSDGVKHGISNEGRVLLLHQAAICACDAILLAVGLRVSVGDRAHVLRLQTALEQLPGDTTELLEALDVSRAIRVEASYRRFVVPEATAGDAEEATRELYGLAEGVLAS
jgi:hypothetical protein